MIENVERFHLELHVESFEILFTKVSLSIDTSKFERPGPVIELRDRFPNAADGFRRGRAGLSRFRCSAGSIITINVVPPEHFTDTYATGWAAATEAVISPRRVTKTHRLNVHVRIYFSSRICWLR